MKSKPVRSPSPVHGPVSFEDAEAKTFWNEFFDIFGISRRRVATFEDRVKKRMMVSPPEF